MENQVERGVSKPNYMPPERIKFTLEGCKFPSDIAALLDALDGATVHLDEKAFQLSEPKMCMQASRIHVQSGPMVSFGDQTSLVVEAALVPVTVPV